MNSMEIGSKMGYNYQVTPPQVANKPKTDDSPVEKEAKVKIKPNSSRVVQGNKNESLITKEAIATDVQEKNNNQAKYDSEKEQNSDRQAFQNDEMMFKAIEEANKKLQTVNKEFEFSIHDRTKQIVVKVKNSETDEIIREIPSEKILDMVANMYELAGIMVDEKR